MELATVRDANSLIPDEKPLRSLLYRVCQGHIEMSSVPSLEHTCRVHTIALSDSGSSVADWVD